MDPSIDPFNVGTTDPLLDPSQMIDPSLYTGVDPSTMDTSVSAVGQPVDTTYIASSGSTPAPVPTDGGSSTNWLADASVLNNIALGWASIFASPTRQISPYGTTTTVPAFSTYSTPLGTQFNVGSGVLVVGALAIVALLVFRK